MRRTAFKPVLDAMEPRISLSTSSSGDNPIADFFKNLFGQSTTTAADKPQYTPAQIAKIHARRHALREARMEKFAEWHAAHPRHSAAHGK
jgi:hypothetical protein